MFLIIKSHIHVFVIRNYLETIKKKPTENKLFQKNPVYHNITQCVFMDKGFTQRSASLNCLNVAHYINVHNIKIVDTLLRRQLSQ